MRFVTFQYGENSKPRFGFKKNNYIIDIVHASNWVNESNEDPRFLFEDSDEGRQAILDEYTKINEETYEILPDYFNELPQAKVVKTKAGHFVQEETPRKVVESIKEIFKL